MLAAANGHPDCVSLLVAHSADINRASNVSRPRCIATPVLLEYVLNLFRYAQNGETALMLAAGLGRPECVSILIANGADVNFVSDVSECR